MLDLLANLRPALPSQRDTVWIASVEESGAVRLSTRVVLGSEENRLFLCSSDGSGLVANIQARPNVALSAASPTALAGSQVKGRAMLHRSGPVWERWAPQAAQVGFPSSAVIIELRAFLEFAVQPSENLNQPRSKEAN